jgi:hypothetical protein
MVAPSEKMSVAGVASPPWMRSGAMYDGVPTTRLLVIRVALGESTTPKSMMYGPTSPSRTLLGLRSRCTRPAAWIEASASARPAASVSTAPGESAPCPSTQRSRLGPSM